MAMRRFRIASALPRNVFLYSLVSFPLLGAGEAFVTPNRPAGGPFSFSAYIPDACISPHPRFSALASNIRSRRGQKVNIQMPLYRDVQTTFSYVTEITDERFLQYDLHIPPMKHKEYSDLTAEAANKELLNWSDPSLPEEERECLAAIFADSCTPFDFKVPEDSLPLSEACKTTKTSLSNPTAIGKPYIAKEGHIHMDAMAFGMGCCCLQVTFQARDVKESRLLYDQLAVMAPLLLALSANSPIWRGHLSSCDTRWEVISQSVDCRTPYERGEEDTTPAPSWMEVCKNSVHNSAGNGKRRIAKSRYSSIDAYISDSPDLLDEYNDIPLQYDEESYAKLVEAGLDDRLAKHVAHLFIRDPLVIFKERTDTVDDTISSEHFENIQSTNWRSVRWKPPPVNAAVSGTIGWRVEIRTMESQLTDFENAAYTIFIVLLTRVILFFKLRLYIPISLVEENFRRASTQDAIWKQKFWYRRCITPLGNCCEGREDQSAKSPGPSATAPHSEDSCEDSQWMEMSLADILLGNAESNFPGLVPLIFAYLDLIECDSASRLVIARYLRLICQRAAGKVMTGAAWQRDYIKNHPAYKKDSVVSPEIVRDMLERIRQLAEGEFIDPRLQGCKSTHERYYKTFKMPMKKDPKRSSEAEEIHNIVNQKLTAIRISADNPDMQLPLSPRFVDDASQSGDESSSEDLSTRSSNALDPTSVPESLFPFDHSAVDDSSPLSSHSHRNDQASESSVDSGESRSTGRMRGSSFSEEVLFPSSSHCEVLRNLVTYYTSIMGIKKSRSKHHKKSGSVPHPCDEGKTIISPGGTAKECPIRNGGICLNNGVCGNGESRVSEASAVMTEGCTSPVLQSFLERNPSLSGGVPRTPDLVGMRGDIGPLSSHKEPSVPPQIEELSLN